MSHFVQCTAAPLTLRLAATSDVMTNHHDVVWLLYSCVEGHMLMFMVPTPAACKA